jgi:hypothetical protein
MLLVDTKEKAVTKDEALKLQIAAARPLKEWLTNIVRTFFITNISTLNALCT